ncbi:hypothetical protein COY28_00455 [Candidatus Woesearchaeota archaeon CG_4_10_14_0_2_um_filter_57_5]|nr:MAG: hypothetical protein AUJ68_06510 [Candidatus Woesearchaeota archaeon CG1_02_57_44]PIN69160.1 MAG: hypothetical protein COV94_03230 [Candidatus Woesearchaeota archaeon CG11_big_fil_rev_8_21_14_0_20_57_5]PIZ56943.1 MAG: hypothetical protein COY28_00455 [Candidatus Woesearchaeota archaeon CG_4_10_14_0_2_um_filter_57_5]
MSEVSNKTLATLLIAAIVVSLTGTLVSLNKIGTSQSIVTLMDGLTGRAVTEGTAQLEIEQLVQVNLSITTIDFGTGYVDPVYSNCSMNTITGGNNTCATLPGTHAGAGMVLENTGNVNINVTVQHTKNATSLLSETMESSTPEFKHAARDNETTGATFIIPVWTEINADNETLMIANLTPSETQDEFWYDILVNIPDDAFPGAKASTVTFTAYYCGAGPDC